MNAVELSNITFTYPTETEEIVLDDLSCHIESGELVALVGPSGAGKTSLCRLIAGFIPHHFDGELTGTAVVAGQDVAHSSIGELAGSVGFVFDTPFDQLTGANSTVFAEAAFSLENLGVPREEIIQRVEDSLEVVGIAHLSDRHPARLSGGQCQRLALASILAMRPDILVLDEPTSQLDPLGAEEVYQVVSQMHERGFTVIVASQDVSALAPFADRMISMEGGRIVDEGHPREVLARAATSEAQVPVPDVLQLGLGLRQQGLVPAETALPLSVAEAVRELTHAGLTNGVVTAPGPPPAPLPTAGASDVQIHQVGFAYPRGASVLADLDLKLEAGCICLLGQNGAGKSTLAKLINGLLRPEEGRVVVDGVDTSEVRLAQVAQHVGLAFQNPDDQLFKNTVAKEIAFGPTNMGYTEERCADLVEETLRRLDLEHHRDRRPQELSLAERKRVAVASVVAMDTPIIVLDEPTGAQDLHGTQLLGRLVDELAAEGRVVVVITHDVEFAQLHATRIVALHSGRVLLDGSSTEVFSQPEELARTHVLPPAIARVSTGIGLREPVFTPTALLEVVTSARGRARN